MSNNLGPPKAQAVRLLWGPGGNTLGGTGITLCCPGPTPPNPGELPLLIDG
jgi:hypothetical protein